MAGREHDSVLSAWRAILSAEEDAAGSAGPCRGDIQAATLVDIRDRQSKGGGVPGIFFIEEVSLRCRQDIRLAVAIQAEVTRNHIGIAVAVEIANRHSAGVRVRRTELFLAAANSRLPAVRNHGNL